MKYASVAQSVERWSENPVVASSILAGGTLIIPFRLMAGHRSLKPRMEVRLFQRKSNMQCHTYCFGATVQKHADTSFSTMNGAELLTKWCFSHKKAARSSY